MILFVCSWASKKLKFWICVIIINELIKHWYLEGLSTLDYWYSMCSESICISHAHIFIFISDTLWNPAFGILYTALLNHVIIAWQAYWFVIYVIFRGIKYTSNFLKFFKCLCSLYTFITHCDVLYFRLLVWPLTGFTFNLDCKLLCLCQTVDVALQ